MHKEFNLNPVEGFAKIDKICKKTLQNIAKMLGSTRKNIAFDAKHKTIRVKFIRPISVRDFNGIFAKNSVEALTLLILSNAKSRFA